MSSSTTSKIIRLSDSFLKPYRDGKIKTPFGPVGAVTYYRTYSRKDQTYLYPDGRREEINGVMEHWVDTCKRVTEGNFNLLPDDPTATPENAQKFFNYMFTMGLLPPGRGLWMLGTKYQQERGGDALNNCWFVAVRPQSYQQHEPFKDLGTIFRDDTKPMVSFPFVFTFDRAMTGGGVGFSVEQQNMLQIPQVTSKVDLKIYLEASHPDWEYIKGHEDYEKIKDVLTDDPYYLENGYVYDVADSRQGWGASYGELIDSHFESENQNISLTFDMSRVRGYGTKIKGFGGTASGPLPLMVLFNDVNNILNKRYENYITSTDALDMLNLTGRCVVAGNVRRTALISIGNAQDKSYVDAKNYMLVAPIMEKDENGWTKWENGKQVRLPYHEAVKLVLKDILKEENVKDFNSLDTDEKERLLNVADERANELYYTAWAQENHRWASNNSVFTDDKFEDWGFISAGIIANGEPGVINKYLMKNFGRIVDGIQEGIDKDAEGMNPCAEIALANGEPCNLIEVLPYMCHQHQYNIEEVLELATQYVYRITFAKYEWQVTQDIIEKNRRIGVSLTGVQDYFLDKYGKYVVEGFSQKIDGTSDPIFNKDMVDEVDSWYKVVANTNQKHARMLGSTPSIKLTTMKPSGTVSKLPGLSAGIHFHYAPYLIQRIRFHELDENLKVLKECGYHVEPAQREPSTVVVSFPVKAPNADHPNFKSAETVSLEEQFANQYFFAAYWADNAVSATLTFQYEEQDQIEPLLANYGKKIKSISLLPYSGHGYVQAPWEPITKEQYEEMNAKITKKPEEIYEHLLSLTLIEGMEDAECLSGACPTK